jgi:hypothetical protein
MLGMTSNSAMNIVFAGAAVVGPIVAIAIFWFGLRSARRHDQAHPSPWRKPD